MILGHPALRLLARRKFTGALRKQLRRLKSVRGLVFAVIGFSAIVLWMGSALGNAFLAGSRGSVYTIDEPMARAIGTLILIMSLVGALSFRGLYLPREEIELLFSAPVRGSDVVRYRLFTSLSKSILGSIFAAVVAMGRVPVPLFGFVGAFLATMTIPIVAQVLSLLAGDAENGWLRRVPRGALRAFNAIGILSILAILFLSTRERADSVGPEGLAHVSLGLLRHPLVDTLTRIAWPWAVLATTDSPRTFFVLLVVCLAFWLAAFEFCARLKVDHRELSLETSADVARRLSRMRRGGAGASAGRAAASSASWRVPWLFGRGPFGALAWRKTGTMLRKARGTLLISGALVSAIVIATRLMFEGDSEQSVLAAGAVIAGFGTLYLCAGLRFDFREDLDRMDVVRSWPMAPWRVFLATLLPEVALVSVFLTLAILARAALSGVLPPELAALVGAVAPTVLAWVSIDNLVFLVWPQRMTPGTEGLLQQAGRSMLLMLLRALLVGVAGGLAGGLAWLVHFAGGGLPLAILSAALVLVLLCTLLVFLGGEALGRFDVARDR